MSNLISLCWVMGFALVLAGCDSSQSSQKEKADSKATPFPSSESAALTESDTVVETSVSPPASSANNTSKDDDSETAVPVDSAEARENDWHALLVGCTTYENLEPEASLRGPSNDVQLMRHVLIDKFGLLPERTTTLVEENEETHRPTRKNILRELKRLEDETERGESVFILLSGHGSQQPDEDPENVQDIEPDGLDEVFLPADVTFPEQPEDLSIGNAILDDELRETLTHFRKKGVFVLFISDSCHSGSSLRGTERYRQLPPERFFSRNLLQQAREKAANVNTAPKHSEFDVPSDVTGEYVAIYAAQPHEPTIELPLPVGGYFSQWRGLLSYTMSKILVESPEKLTYRELVQQIHADYVQSMGRLGPTPLIEGSGQDRIVFGGESKKSSSNLALLQNEEGEWIVRAGQLHGLSKEAILAVGAPPGTTQQKSPLGYVRVSEAQLSESTVEPVAFEKTPVNRALPLGGVCQIVQIARNPYSLKIAIESPETSDEIEKSITKALTQEGPEPALSVELIDDSQNADWTIEIDERQVVLEPASQWREKSEGNVYVFEIAEADWIDRLEQTLRQISRASGLLRVSGMQKARRKNFGANRDSMSLSDIELELVRVSDDNSPEPLKWESSGLKLEDGEVVSLKITNAGLYVIDFTALFMDSQHGISVLFPEPDVVADNRISPGQEFTVGPMRVDASTAGLEHLIVIASPARGQPLDWSWLAQPSLESSATRGAAFRESLQTSTGELLKIAMFTSGSNRGLQKVAPDDVTMEVISWTTKRDRVAPPAKRDRAETR